MDTTKREWRKGIMKRPVDVELGYVWSRFFVKGEEVFEFDGGVVGEIDMTKFALVTDRPGGQPVYKIPADAVEWQ